MTTKPSSDYQFELFEKLQRLSNKTRLLGSFIQNDFERSLKEGYVSREGIKDSIPEYSKYASEVITELKELSPKVIELMDYWSSNALNRIDWSNCD